jgi:hypothetical protein
MIDTQQLAAVFQLFVESASIAYSFDNEVDPHRDHQE